MDIIQLAKLPESKALEFKRDTSSLDNILKAIIAFSNTAGGILLIGIEDDGTICGIESPAKIQEQIANSIANRIKPHLLPEFSIYTANGVQVLAVQIEHRPEPYYLANKGLEKGVYYRLANSNRMATTEMVAEMQRANHHPFFDSTPCDSVGEKDLDKTLIKKTFSHRDTEITTEKLLTLDILVRRGRRVVATNGGVLLFGKPDIRQRYFPFAEVRCARFAGTSRAEFIDRMNIEGGILGAITEVPKFIRRNTRMAGKFGAMRRRDIPEYPVNGIRETLTNALVHANYEVSGTRIFVAIYDDKLEIQNPGIMPPGMSIEQFKAGISRLRNPVIARVFGELELVEEWGSGYKRIKDACVEGGYPLPTWEEFGSALRVTFYPHPEVTQAAQLGAKSGTQLAPSWHLVVEQLGLDEGMLQLIAFCCEPRAFQEMLAHMGWQDRTKFRRRFISPLLEKGMIKRTIPDKPSSSKQKYLATDNAIELLQEIKEKR